MSIKLGQLLSMPGFCLKRSPGICSRKRTLQSDTAIHCRVPREGTLNFALPVRGETNIYNYNSFLKFAADMLGLILNAWVRIYGLIPSNNFRKNSLCLST